MSRRVAITGAASGIGAATAARLAREGAFVLGVDRAPVAGADEAVEADLATRRGWEAAAEAASRHGPFDALISCAGLPPRNGNAVPMLAVNYFGLTGFAAAMEPALAANASVVHVASRAGMAWRENLAQVGRLMALPGPEALAGFVAEEGIDEARAYRLSKEAVIVATRLAAAASVGSGRRVCSISPSAVATDILDDFLGAFGEMARKGLALTGRAGTAEEVAAVAAFLAGPGARWVNGIDMLVDGGLSAAVEADTLRQALGLS